MTYPCLNSFCAYSLVVLFFHGHDTYAIPTDVTVTDEGITRPLNILKPGKAPERDHLTGFQSDLKPLPEAFDDLFPLFNATIPSLPEQVHLSLGDDSSSVVVLWSTGEEADDGLSFVHYGEGEDNFTLSSAAESESFFLGNPDGCHGVYRAVMTDLRPRTVYSYKVQTESHHSKVFTFTSPDHTVSRPSKYLVYGDLGKKGGGSIMRKLERDLKGSHYDAILHVGDFAYDFQDEGGRRGDSFMNRVERLATLVPYVTAPGNHEIPNNFSHYRYRYSAPSTPWPIPEDKMWFSFKSGLVHFISYSTEVYFAYNETDYAEAQYDWLTEELEAANRMRAVRPWIIVFGHRPMYCSNLNRDDCTHEISTLRQEPYNLETLFHTAGVDLIIEAHEHSYERLYPLYNGTQTDCGYINPHAPVHVISGAAGCNERDIICANVFLDDIQHWSAARSWFPGLNGYGRLIVENSTHLLWEQVLALSDQPLDSFWVVQHNHTTRDTNVSENRCHN